MTAEDLARWDISLINRSLLTAESYDEMFREVTLKDGKPTGYGLGVSVAVKDGHKRIEHSGEVSGFVSENIVLPDTRTAIVVLTNQDANPAAGTIGNDIAEAIGAKTPAETRTLSILNGLQNGQIDRSQFTTLCNNYFTAEAVSDFAGSLRLLGEPLSVTQEHEAHRGAHCARHSRGRADDDLEAGDVGGVLH